MTVLATSVLAQPHLPGWVQFVGVMVVALTVLMIASSRIELPEGAAQRLVVCSLAVLAVVVVASAVAHAAGGHVVKPDVIIIACDPKIYWWDYFGWIC